DIAALRAEIALQRSSTLSDEDFCASDVRFHRALVTAAGNGPLSLMMYTVVEAFMPITNMIVSQVRERGSVAGFHERLADAVEARDGRGSVDVLAELLNSVRDSYATSLARRAERDAARAKRG